MPLALNIVGGVGTTPKPPLWTDPGHTSNLTPHKEQVHPLSESKHADDTRGWQCPFAQGDEGCQSAIVTVVPISKRGRQRGKDAAMQCGKDSTARC